MRSSKSRSRSKGNRNRSVGNVVNRVFDSSGPEGKVRGTPQQIIDKYNQLARDAQLSNDRVATENFQQHAEHYLRMLADAQREQQERQQQNQQNQNSGQGGGQQGGDTQGDARPEGGDQQQRRRRDNRGQQADQRESNQQPSGDVIEMDTDSDGGLVDTPEEKPKRARKPRKPKVDDAQPVVEAQVPPDAAE